MPRVLSANDATHVEAAAQRLAAGSLVGMPTETVYGLAADAGNASAVHRVFEAKGRPSDHPLIVHIAPAATLDAGGWRAAVAPYASEVPDFALALMERFWPGPLTLILPRHPEVAAVAAGGQSSVGLRCPMHPAAQALLVAARAHGVLGVAAPSANRFGRVSPTTAAHVAEEFADLGEDQLLILDGGACPVGIESTIVDASRGVPVLLRPGMLTPAELEAACGQPLRDRDAQAPKASGTLASHYAPRATVRLMTAQQLQTGLDMLGKDAKNIAVYASAGVRVASKSVPVRSMPASAAACAQELFAVLRELDATGVRLIWVETPPSDAAWDGVRDRLQRAAA
ncbi:L-threonylcarbamoyladenylate synthase [Hydrogenophaga sp. PAMC20947]|uniref:L-threonylcarbamoyladenylate synthase n=1 Tax=Hydrogenophaga sp. PAMC20947 TaxID=2565558 RepID=UPI00109E2B0B|nr:L-threonylcarbamoyladenylate synthase [Hydrogenophaga sp. PAMC20947]QCB47937.1 threonylcarbamoyl-AMP synthase [Hydrogenophaga sp. PAMC20947]